MSNLGAIGIFVALVGGVAGVARADVVMPPPASCPPGSQPQSSHAGPLCAPAADCHADAECTGGTRCVAVQHCVESRQCGGWSSGNPNCHVETVAGDCGAGGACASGTCRERHVCTAGATPPPTTPPPSTPPPSTPPSPPPPSTQPPAQAHDDDCSVGGSAGRALPLGGLIAGALAVALATARRRRAR